MCGAACSRFLAHSCWRAGRESAGSFLRPVSAPDGRQNGRFPASGRFRSSRTDRRSSCSRPFTQSFEEKLRRHLAFFCRDWYNANGTMYAGGARIPNPVCIL